MKHYSIIIPTFNESENIEPLLYQIEEVVNSNGMEPEVIFVDDGSTDSTRLVIQNYRGPLDINLICRDRDRGLTSAVVKGAHVAKHEAVVVMDADLSHCPTVIPSLLKPIEDGIYEMSIGSRFIEGGETPGLTRFRRLGSKMAILGSRIFTPVKDPLSGFFAVKRERLLLEPVAGDGFKIALEVLANAEKEFRVLEVPITFKDRYLGSSKMNFAILKSYFLQLIRLAGKKENCAELFFTPLASLLGGLLGCILIFTFSTYEIKTSTSHTFSLLLVSHLVWFASFFFTAKRAEGGFLKSYPTFLFIVLLGLFLRGGILSWLPGISPLGHYVYATIFITTTLTILAAQLVAFNRKYRLLELSWQQLGLFLIGYSLLLRLVYLGSSELLQEEAYYWNYSQHMAAGYLDHPPMVALLIKCGTMLFGHNEFGVRIGAYLCWFITAFFSWRLTQLLFDKASAFRVLILLAMLPIFFGTGLVMTPDAPLIACWAGAIYYLYRALVQMQPKAWYGAGLFLGLGMVSKYTIAFLGPAILLYVLLDSSARKWLFRFQPYLAAILAIVIFSPVIWWNYHNDWASFLFQSQGRIQEQTEFSTHELLLSILLLLTPTGLLSATSVLIPKPYSFCLPGSTKNTSRRSYAYCLIMAVIPLAIITLFSLSKEVKLNWTGPLWLSVIPLIAFAMAHRTSKPGWQVASLWPKTLIALVISYGALLHYSAIGFPGVPYGSGTILFGWDHFAQQIEDEVGSITEQQGERPLVAGINKYKTASGLAFYRSKVQSEPIELNLVDETTSRQLFGYNALMYGYWHPPSEAKGRDVLVISAKKNWLKAPVYKDRYHSLGPIRELTIQKNDKVVGRYYYRLLIGYSPKEQRSSVTDLVIVDKMIATSL